MKYQTLTSKFSMKYNLTRRHFLNKNLELLKINKPGQSFKFLRRMGAQPGDCSEEGMFLLPSHDRENLADQQSA